MPFKLKSRLSVEAPALGTFVFSNDPAMTEIAALAGFDFVIVDREHTAMSWREIIGHVRAADAGGISVLVRTRGPDGDEVTHALDLGAEGVVIPHFGLERERSISCVRSARFAPMGDRGTCTGTRPGGFGLNNFARVVEESNRDALVVVQIEDVQVLPILDDLFKEVQVDAVMPGLADLSTSLGKPGAFSDDEVIAAADAVFNSSTGAGLPMGFYVANAAETARWSKRQASFFVYAIDYKVVAEGYRNAVQMLKGV